jgi:hypothetical protein
MKKVATPLGCSHFLFEIGILNRILDKSSSAADSHAMNEHRGNHWITINVAFDTVAVFLAVNHFYFYRAILHDQLSKTHKMLPAHKRSNP